MRLGRYRMSLPQRERGEALALLYCVLALLLPGVILAGTEQYPLPAALASLSLSAGFYLLWLSLSPRRGVMFLLLLPVVALCSLQLVLLYIFGGSVVAVDMFTNIMTTSPGEAGELLLSISPAMFIVAAVYGLPVVWAAVSLIRRRRMEPRMRRSAAAAGAAMLLAGCVVWLTAGRGVFSPGTQLFPLNALCNVGCSLKAWSRARSYPATCSGFSFGAVRRSVPDCREIYVMVVGETARADHWQILGYERATNPLLSQLPGLCPLRCMVTQSNVTHKSVPLMLSPVSAENYSDIYRCKSIMALFREAGFRTVFISAQPRNKNLTDRFAEQADSAIYFDDIPGAEYDGDMLPLLERTIAADSASLFVVLHCYGSHYSYARRCPGGFARFTPCSDIDANPVNRPEIVNAYDNTVVYTDWFLSRVAGLLSADPAVCSAMLYCADHGEDLFDDGRNCFLHSSTRLTGYQLHVASFGWFSEKFAGLFPAKVAAARRNAGTLVTTHCIFHTLADMASVESPFVDGSQALTAASFDASSPISFLGDRYEPLSYLEAGLTAADMRVLASRGIFFGSRTSSP